MPVFFIELWSVLSRGKKSTTHLHQTVWIWNENSFVRVVHYKFKMWNLQYRFLDCQANRIDSETTYKSLDLT